MPTGRVVALALFLSLPLRQFLDAQSAAKPTFEEYLKKSAVTREMIDRFLRGPSWARFDPELDYVLGNYLPSGGMDNSATLSTVQANGARTSLVYAGKKTRLRGQFQPLSPGQRQ